MYIDRSCRSTAPGLYGFSPADQPNATCMCAYGAPSSTCEPRWTLGTVANVEAVVVHQLLAIAADLAPTVVPALACSTSQ